MECLGSQETLDVAQHGLRDLEAESSLFSRVRSEPSKRSTVWILPPRTHKSQTHGFSAGASEDPISSSSHGGNSTGATWPYQPSTNMRKAQFRCCSLCLPLCFSASLLLQALGLPSSLCPLLPRSQHSATFMRSGATGRVLPCAEALAVPKVESLFTQ